MYQPFRTSYYFKANDKPLPEKWNLLRGVGEKALSFPARLKLEWIIFYFTQGKKNAKVTAKYFGINRKTLHKWLKRFDEENLRSLEEDSRAPHKVRGWEVTRKQEERIISLRKKHIKYGKEKLKVIYKREYKEEISAWKIERVIRKHQLYFDPTKVKKKTLKQRISKTKTRISEMVKKDEYGFLWHIDTIILYWYGVRRVIFTAIEDLTKIAYARIYPTNSSVFAEEFLKRLMYVVEGKVEFMHQDNGVEFAGDFEKACCDLGVLQVYSRPHTPKDNPSLERFNRTIQDEWLDLSEEGLNDIKIANVDLTNWLIEYNNYRPHESLDYQTPLEYAQQQYFKVLPMWSASTKS